MNTETPTANDQNQHMNSRLASWDTLDEPIWDTVTRDISSIGLKLKHILIPASDREIYLNVCKNWDLWGPFIFCTYIAFALNSCGEECGDRYDHTSNFSSIFMLLWVGNLAICLNYKLLLKNDIGKRANVTPTSSNGAVQSTTTNFPMSIFQLLCLFGYSLAIPCIGIAFMQILRIFSSSTFFYERVIISTVFGFIYPVASTLKMLSTYITGGKYFLVVYPIMMFFSVLSLYLYTIV